MQINGLVPPLRTPQALFTTEFIPRAIVHLVGWPHLHDRHSSYSFLSADFFRSRIISFARNTISQMLFSAPNRLFCAEIYTANLVLKRGFSWYPNIRSLWKRISHFPLCNQYGAAVQKIMWPCVTVTGSCSVQHEGINFFFDVGTRVWELTPTQYPDIRCVNNKSFCLCFSIV